MKRLVAIADTHCGHVHGLTPPAYQSTGELLEEYNHEIQTEMWDFFAHEIEALQPIDVLVVLGDAIDGKAAKSGGLELLTCDRAKQCEIAAACIDYCRASKIYICKGTPYHVGKEEDWEQVLAGMVDAEIFGHDWLECEGVVFDLKHKASRSVIPYGRHTPLSRSMVWNRLNAAQGREPRADILLRAHNHYYAFSGARDSLEIAMPALEGSTEFGAMQAEGNSDIGFLVFECDKGGYTWEPKLLDVENLVREPLHV